MTHSMTIEKITIKQASHEDAKLIKNILQTVYEPYTLNFSPTALQFTENIIAQESSKWLVAKYKSEIVGAVRFELYDFYLDFHFLCVMPSFRKTGVGNKLFKELKEIAHKNKKSYIKIVLRDSLNYNRHYFESKGFYYSHKYPTNLHSVFILKLDGEKS